MQRAAIMCGPGFGDGLIFSVIANNLVLNGYEVTLYHNALESLSPWLPSFRILPLPTISWTQVAKDYDLFVIEAHAPVLKKEPCPDLKAFPQIKLICSWHLDRMQSFVVNLVDFCQKELDLKNVVHQIGLKINPELNYRRYKKRVAIHPLSSDPDKNWSLNKFKRLYRILLKEGYEPVMVMSKAEEADFDDPFIATKSFETLVDLGSYLYESAYFIGNDSGPGHLASTLGIPTVTIFARLSQTVQKFWRPGWGLNETVAALPIMPGHYLRSRTWRQLLPVSRVLSRFHKLAKEVP